MLVIGEEHDVGMLLQQCRGPGLELDHVAVVGLVLGAVETLDVGMGDLHDRHALLVPERVELVEVLAPDVEGLGIALAEAGILDRRPVVALAGFRPDERLQPVDAVDHHRAELVAAR